MNIVIFGASGGVGRCLVEQALAQGYNVTTAVRNPATLNINHPRLRALPCDVLDVTSVEKACAKQDVAFSTIGAHSRGPITLYSTGAKNIVQGMRAHGVRRLVFLSNFGILGETAQDIRGRALLFLAKRLIHHTIADHRRALDVIRENAPEWTVVRPLALKNGPRTQRYRIATDNLPKKGFQITRADVADFMLRQATRDDYLYKVPAIAN
jgi:putative NADH-flavin reductase